VLSMRLHKLDLNNSESSSRRGGTGEGRTSWSRSQVGQIGVVGVGPLLCVDSAGRL